MEHFKFFPMKFFFIIFYCVYYIQVNCTPRGGGGTLKSVYIGEADFFGVKILNFRIFWGFQKN